MGNRLPTPTRSNTLSLSQDYPNKQQAEQAIEQLDAHDIGYSVADPSIWQAADDTPVTLKLNFFNHTDYTRAKGYL
jgi:hypothetical protein